MENGMRNMMRIHGFSSEQNPLCHYLVHIHMFFFTMSRNCWEGADKSWILLMVCFSLYHLVIQHSYGKHTINGHFQKLSWHNQRVVTLLQSIPCFQTNPMPDSLASPCRRWWGAPIVPHLGKPLKLFRKTIGESPKTVVKQRWFRGNLPRGPI